MTIPTLVLYSFLTKRAVVFAHSQCPLSVFECAGPMYNIHTEAVVLLWKDRLAFLRFLGTNLGFIL